MLPINFLDRPLIRDAIRERERAVPLDRRGSRGGGALLFIHAKGGVILRRWKLRIDRRGDGDDDA